METVELRVHGVHGTSPGSMLGVADGEVGQVAGDKVTGIYRAKGKVELPYRDLKDQPVSVEAYSWGSLTSGVQGLLGWVKRALWLLLLPFALANLAYWARLELAHQNGTARWGARAVRWSALLLTLFLVLTPCVVAVDMVSWQCYRYDVPGCTHLPGMFHGLADLTEMQRIAVGSTVPMLLVLLLWLLSRQTLARYEEVKVGAMGVTSVTDANTLVLRDTRLWRGGTRTRRLQRIHLAAAMAMVVVFCGVHLLGTLEGEDGLREHLFGFFPLTAVTLLGVALLLACFGLLFREHPMDLESTAPELTDAQQAQAAKRDGALAIGALGLWVVFVVVVCAWGPAVEEERDFVGHNVWFIGVFVLLTMLHLSVFVGGRMSRAPAVATALVIPLASFVILVWLYHDGELSGGPLWSGVILAIVFWASLTTWHYQYQPPAGRQTISDKAWRGAGASVLLATAAWIALLFTSSIVVAAGNYLNGGDHGVADLVSTVEPAKNAAPPPTSVDVGNAADLTFRASGDVVIEEANVERSGDTVTVTSGRVVVGRLWLKGKGLGETSIRAGDLIAGQRATIILPEDQVRLADSCFGGSNEAFRPPATSSGLTPDGFRKRICTAEKDGFRASALLPAKDKALVIAPFGEVDLRPTSPPQQPLVVPQVLIWTPIGQLLWIVLVLGAMIWCVVWYFRNAGAQIAAGLPTEGASWPDLLVPTRDRQAVRTARVTAGLAHRAERLLDIVGAITSPVALVVIVLSTSGVAPWELMGWTRPFATISMYVVLGLSLGLVALGSQIRRSAEARKAVGVIWDLTTFWPRAAHPLAPPCYAERVVPELETRTRWALRRAPDNVVVLSGHSQGSLIVASMASRLSDDELERVRMVTYGSQIRALYGRVFPRVFGAAAMGYRPTDGMTTLADGFPDVPRANPPAGPPTMPPAGSLRARLGALHWVNFFRRADPLGYRVFSDVDSYCDRPVPEVPLKRLGDPGPPVMTHSAYQHTPRYRWQVCEWTGEGLVPPAGGTQDVPELPRI